MKKNLITWTIVVLLSFGFTTSVTAEELIPPTGEMTRSLPWIEVTLPYSLTVKELAKMYYADENDYKIIYDANREILSRNLRFGKGTLVKIPVTAKFRNQPLRLGWN